MTLRYRSALLAALLVLPAATLASAQNGPSPEIRAIIDGLVETLNQSDYESLAAYVALKFDPGFVQELGNEVIEQRLREIRTAIAGAGEIDVGRRQTGLVLTFSSPARKTEVSLGIPFVEPNLITALEFQVRETGQAPEMDEPATREEALEIRARAFEEVWGMGSAGVEYFLESHAAQSADLEAMRRVLQEAARIGAAAGGIMLDYSQRGVLVRLRGPSSGDFELTVQEHAPFKVSEVTLSEAPAEAMDPGPEVTFDSASTVLSELEAEGFSGSVLLARGDEIVLQEGYGLRSEDGQSVTTDTQFDIGSMPIDFTRGAALLLAQRGLLDLQAPIAQYLDAVPSDKAAVTVEHLMTGASGLPNYHHVAEDADHDLTYIDRDEAIRRILSRELLFSPGSDDVHSHSAWTLLAAIIDTIHPTGYQDLLQKSFFEPAGMTRTAFYGPDARFTESDQAEGMGHSRPTDPNIPLNWGPVSWLVMGSGGMVSTPGDLYRWHRFIRSDRLLTTAYRALLPKGGMSAGDSDRGFLTMVGFSPDRFAMVMTNGFGRRGDPSASVARAVARLGMDPPQMR